MNAVTRQAFSLLISTVTKEKPAKTDEEYAERIILWLVKSIRYKYKPSEGIEETAQLIKEVTRRTHEFAEGSIPHTILSQLKKKLDSDRKLEGTFISFLGKLVEKGKGYTTISKPEKVDYPNWTFKVLEDTASILTDNLEEESFISDILEDLNKSEKLEYITRIIRTYNLRSRSISPTVTKKKLVIPKTRKRRKSLPLGPLSSPLVNPVINNARIVLLTLVAGNVLQTQINMLA